MVWASYLSSFLLILLKCFGYFWKKHDASSHVFARDHCFILCQLLDAWPFSSSFYILTLLSHINSLIDFLLIFKLSSSIANVFIRMKISFPKQNEYLSLQYLRFPTLKSFKISSFFLKYFVFPLWDLTISIPYFF